MHFYSENRYLLLLTENYGALTILQQKIFTMDNAVVIFGSSFPSDQEYTQVIFFFYFHYHRQTLLPLFNPFTSIK